MLATVHCKRAHVGVLVRFPQSELLCMRGTTLERLVQERVEAALASELAKAWASGERSS